MEFPLVTRKRFNMLYDFALYLLSENDRLRAEKDTIVGNACTLADIEREDRKLERSHFEAILTNMRDDHAKS